jgi:atypical dual specificity phosphatase
MEINSLGVGLYNSRVFKAVVLTTATVAAFALVLNPPAWILAAAAVATFVWSIWAVSPASPRVIADEVSMEFATIRRLFNEKNFSEIKGTNVLLGSIPNRLSGDMKKLEGVGAILSVNDPWERKPMGLSLPYEKEEWEKANVRYFEMNQPDHIPLSVKRANLAADWIHEQVSLGKKVLVHCRAGKGRSATAVAAYLIKYKGMSVDEASQLIKTCRSVSNIMKHKFQKRLQEFAAGLSARKTNS